MNTLIKISFSGRDFYGTQKQKDKRTVQGAFEEILSQLYQEKIKVVICSRLDRFVNALDYALSFKSQVDKFEPSKLKYILQRYFGSEVLIKDVIKVPDDFTARKDSLFKTYLYIIQNGRIFNPVLKDLTYVPGIKLDIQKAKEAIKLFQGEHDFINFCTLEEEKNTRLSLEEVKATADGDFIYLRFKGKAFLRYQVRYMVGAIVDCAQGLSDIQDIQNRLDGVNISPLKKKAPAWALYLEKIEYEGLEGKPENPAFPDVYF